MTVLLRNRKGLTLVELLVALIVASLVGGAMLKVMLSEARASSQREAWRSARSVARGSLNRLLSDLRMVEAEGGVEAASNDGQSITVRVPYAMGVLCSSIAPVTASLLPVDGPTWTAASFGGFAWRDTLSGAYTYVTAGVSVTPGALPLCTANSVAAISPSSPSPGRIVLLGGTLGGTPAIGTPVLLFERVQYRFAPSTLLPGKIGLWRTTAGGDEELAAPFDASSRFRYHVQGTPLAQDNAPAPLATFRGVELRLRGESDPSTAGGGTKRVDLTTAVFFKNRRD